MEEELNEAVWRELLSDTHKFCDAIEDMSDILFSGIMPEDRLDGWGLHVKDVGLRGLIALQSIAARVRFGADVSDDERAIAKLVEEAAKVYLEDQVNGR